MEINLNFKKPSGYVWYDDNECSLDVAGVKYRIQDLRKALEMRNPVMILRQEPENEYDENAVKILLGGYHIGYVDRDTAQQIADDIECGDLDFSDLVAMPVSLIIDDENEYYNVEYSLIRPKHPDTPRLRKDHFRLNIHQKEKKMVAPKTESNTIKIMCPSCGQEYNIDETYIGHKVECACGTKFIAEEAQKRCPMCGEKILISAKKCRYCGEYLVANADAKTVNTPTSTTVVPKIPETQRVKTVKPPTPATIVPKIPETYYPTITAAYIGFAMVIPTILLLLSDIENQYVRTGSGLLLLPGILLILVGFAKKNVRCSCGYDGAVKVRGGSLGCLFLLLCIGILPGLIYLIVCRNRYFCPACGREI